jgi:hypothetical protein
MNMSILAPKFGPKKQNGDFFENQSNDVKFKKYAKTISLNETA